MSSFKAPPAFYTTPVDFSTMVTTPNLSGHWNTWLWMVVCGGLAAFFVAWGIGANDVANSFATSVGSGTLKLWQAIIIAGVFEFAGAVGLGTETTKTVAGDIVNAHYFNNQPELYMYGMLCALFIAGLWIVVATYYLLPVSTTHSIIGAICGFAVVIGGGWGIQWNTQSGNFPYSRGLLPVILSWFFSPVIGGSLSSIIFLLNRTFILRSKNSMNRAIYSIPFLVFLTFFINIMFVLAKGAKNYMDNVWPCIVRGTGPVDPRPIGMFGLRYTDCSALNDAAAWIAAVAGFGIACTGGVAFMFYVKHQTLKGMKGTGADTVNVQPKGAWEDSLATDAEKAEDAPEVKYPYPQYPTDDTYLNVIKFVVTWLPIWFVQQCKRGLFTNIHAMSSEKAVSAGLSDNAEVFDFDTERVYQWLQVISACCVAFAHGSNDVANAIGPFSAILHVYGNFTLPTSDSVTQAWLFVLGGAGLVIGLMMFGYTIIYQLGKNLIHLTPSRGYSAELAAGLTISLASFYGIPVSTTQIITGCEVGVGLCEGAKGLSWRLFAKIFFGWVITIFLAMAACAAVFSAGAYPPCITQMTDLNNYRVSLLSAQVRALTQMRGLVQATTGSAYWNNQTNNTIAPYLNGFALNALLESRITSVGRLAVRAGYVDWTYVMYEVSRTSLIQQRTCVTSIGQADFQGLINGTVYYTSLNDTGRYFSSFGNFSGQNPNGYGKL